MTDRATQRARLQLLLIAALFIVPTVGAWLLVNSGWHPSATTNHGELVQPPVRMAPEQWRTPAGEAIGGGWFRGRWTVLAVRDTACDDACRNELDGVLRARIALDRDAARVTPLLLLPAGVQPPADAPPALGLALAPAAQIAELMADLPQSVSVNDTAYFLVDYQGFRMMAYSQPLAAGDLLEDLEHLLRLADDDVERYERSRHQGE